MEDKIVIIFNDMMKKEKTDLEIPLDISANDLVLALNSAFELQIDIYDVKKCYLKAENPIALLRGNKSLRAYGLRNGTIINYTEQR